MFPGLLPEPAKAVTPSGDGAPDAPPEAPR